MLEITMTFESRESESKQIDRTTRDVKSGIPRFSHGDHPLVHLLQVILVLDLPGEEGRENER